MHPGSDVAMRATGQADLRLDRRRFLAGTGGVLWCGLGACAASAARSPDSAEPPAAAPQPRAVKLFLCGDVMTGRGIDQILPHPGDPQLHEGYLKSATEYVALAEAAGGPIPRRVPWEYVWGDVLEALDRARPDARIVNLETAVTTSDAVWVGKEVHYRMHPANVACLTAAAIDCCTLANNHVLDWGREGLLETLVTLHAAGVRTAGAGRDVDDARAPVVLDLPGGGRLLVFAVGSPSAGVPSSWAAGRRRAGVNVMDESDPDSVADTVRAIRSVKRDGDVVVLSVHWGSNWGYEVPTQRRRAAHRLIDEAGVDVVHGHSSHHPRPLEVYGGKLILHGCGDFLNDYEGIGGYEEFRPGLGSVYLPEFDPAKGRLQGLTLLPTHIRQFRIQRATPDEAEWLATRLETAGRAFGTLFDRFPDGRLGLRIDDGEVSVGLHSPPR